MRLSIPEPQPKQREFFTARERFVAYGGARGGGKSWSVRYKALLLALKYPGIRILILRRTFPELRENHIRPMVAMTKGVARYKESDKTLLFANGSIVIFGYCATDNDVGQYQGNEYDIICMDEATHFTEYQFSTLTASLRGANDFPKRFYLTCNPGGVGHAWVKRLFVDRAFRSSERPEDYRFIAAKLTDNPALMEADPGYAAMLDNLPPGIREAWRDGSWDVFAGQYFTEWNRETHVCEAFTPPEWWRWYVSLDYGLDMLAAYLIAVDEGGRAYVVREVYDGKDIGVDSENRLHEGLTVNEAAGRVKELMEGHSITAVLAPPDLWARSAHTGKSTADLFGECGVYLTKAANERVAGWLAVKEFLRERPGEGPRLHIFPGCVNLIRTLPLLQYDGRNPSDTAREPHELTHAPDALRYFCASWTLVGEVPEEDFGPKEKTYEEYMTGGGAESGYIDFWG